MVFRKLFLEWEYFGIGIYRVASHTNKYKEKPQFILKLMKNKYQIKTSSIFFQISHKTVQFFLSFQNLFQHNSIPFRYLIQFSIFLLNKFQIITKISDFRCPNKIILNCAISATSIAIIFVKNFCKILFYFFIDDILNIIFEIGYFINEKYSLVEGQLAF